jgi:hypothetical protein
LITLLLVVAVEAVMVEVRREVLVDLELLQVLQ